MSRSSTLSNFDLKKFCSKQSLNFSLITLSDLNSSDNIPKNSFIFTGNNSDSFNNSYTNHWLFLYGNSLFDSYSYFSHYTLPDWIKPVVTHPKVLQEFGSNVCGEYCCAFYWFIHNIEKDSANLGSHFVNYFQLGNDRAENDKKINEWFNNITK